MKRRLIAWTLFGLTFLLLTEQVGFGTATSIVLIMVAARIVLDA